MKYEALIFDADATLYDFQKAEELSFTQTMQAYGYPADQESYRLYSKINEAMWKKLERGEVGKTELRTLRFDEYAKAAGIQFDADTISQVYTDALAQQGILFEGAMAVIQAASAQIDCYIASNGIGYVQRSRFAKSKLEPYFKQVFISEEVGAEKPDLKFFKTVQDTLGIKKSKQILFVGDSLSADIKGGVQAGWTTVWYNPAHHQNSTTFIPDYEIEDLKEVLTLLKHEK